MYLNALARFRRARDSEAVARVGRGLMDVYMYLGDYRKALEIGKKSLAYYRRKGREDDAAKVMTNIGNVYHRMDNNRMALRYYEKAKKIFRKVGGTALAIVEYNQANIYANLNRLQKARSLYEASAGLYRSAGLEIAETQARYSLAYLYFLEDNYTQAIRIFETVYETFSKLGDRKSAAVTKLDLVEINLHLNQYGSAIMLGEEIVNEFRRLGMRYEQAKARYFIAWARIQLGDLTPAADELKKAHRLFQQERNLLWLGMVSIARARLLTARKKYARATEASREAIRYFTKSGDERRKIDAEITAVETLVAWKKYEPAMKQACALLRRKPTGAQKYSSYYLLGQCYYRQEQYREALRMFKSAVTATERMLTGLYPDEIRFFFLLDKYDAYRMVVDCLLKLQRTGDAFLSNLSALATVNARIAPPRRLKAAVPRHLLENREILRAALKKLNQAPPSQSPSVRTVETYSRVEQKLWTNEQRIRSYRYPVTVRKQAYAEPMEAVRSSLRSDEQVVSYMIRADGSIGAFCASARTTEFVPLSVDENELEVLLRKLHFLFEHALVSRARSEENLSAVRNYLRTLHRMLIAPLEKYLSSSTLIVIVDGLFAQVPFSALVSPDGKALREQFRIRLVVNPQDLAGPRTGKVRIAEKRNSIFAVTSDLLPSVEAEAFRIAEIFPDARLYVGEKSRLDTLTEELRSSSGFVHIAAHASRSSENPLFSRILMSDGPFFPFDLFGHAVRAELLTLSGCQTAAPGLYYGNSFSLAKAFYQAGSQHVLASLWTVSDKLSMIFMAEFYHAWHEEKDLFAAYDRAVEKVKALTNHPAFWGAYILLGI